MTRSKMADRTEPETLRIGFGITDSRGREVGVIVSRFETTFEELPEGARSGYCIEPGYYFTARVQASRDGRSYGSSQSAKYFETEAEREAYVERRISDSRKRASK